MDALYALAVLACPVGMGVMMWVMMRGGKSHDQPTQGTSAADAEVAAMRAELDQLRAEQRDRATDAQPTDRTEPR